MLIVDMQHDFCDPDAPTTLWPSIRQAYDLIKRLCAEARERSVPVIYIQGLVAADGRLIGKWRLKQKFHAEWRIQIEESRGAQIIPELAPQSGYRLIGKWRPSVSHRL